MREEQSEDIISGGPIDLRQSVHARQVGGSRELYGRGGGVDLLLGNANRRIVTDGFFDGSGYGQRSLLAGQGHYRSEHQEHESLGRSHYLPSMSSRNNSRTLLLAADNAFLPRGVARYTFRSDLPLRFSLARR